MWQYNNTDELYHYGILGMKWGVRRYQNKDGSLTPAGRRRYDVAESRAQQKAQKMQTKVDKKVASFTKNDHKTFDTRAKVRDNMEKRFDNKIAKAEQKNMFKAQNLKETKASRLRDFDDGTELVKKGYDAVNAKYSKFLQMKVDAITNPSIKKTAEYVKAGKEYSNLMANYYTYGKAYPVLMEASKQGQAYGEEKYGNK